MRYTDRQIRVQTTWFPFYLLLIYLSAYYSCSGVTLYERGGIESTSDSQIMPLILNKDHGYNFELNQTTDKKNCSFYYFENKIWASLGIARVGLIQKKLSSITEIPFRDED